MLKSIFSVPQVTDMSEFSRRGKIKIFRTNYWKFKSFFKLRTCCRKWWYKPGALFVGLKAQASGVWASALKIRPSWNRRRSSFIVLSVDLWENTKTMRIRHSPFSFNKKCFWEEKKNSSKMDRFLFCVKNNRVTSLQGKAYRGISFLRLLYNTQ